MSSIVTSADPLFAVLTAAYEASRAPILEQDGTCYRRVRDTDGVTFVPIPKAPERDSFGNQTDQFGPYPPDLTNPKTGDFVRT